MAETTNSPENLKLSPPRILFYDHDQGIRELMPGMIKNLLSGHDCEISIVEDLEAIELGSLPWDIIITSLKSGNQAFDAPTIILNKLIESKLPVPPVILISGYPGLDAIAETLRATYNKDTIGHVLDITAITKPNVILDPVGGLKPSLLRVLGIQPPQAD